jgi:hypothetical protein
MNPNRLFPPPPSTSGTLTPKSEPSLDDLVESLARLHIDMGDNNDALQQLIAALAAANLERNTSSKAIRWPEWDGTKDSYTLFKWTIESKIEQEQGRLGSNKTICTNIFAGLPKDKQQRVIHWLQAGGADQLWTPEAFLKHMDDKFLDREEERKSLDKLNRLRQGEKQKFEDFRQQFEQLSAQAGTLAPKDASKVAVMRTALSASLSRLLIPVKLSNTDYDQYVADIQSIATNFEAHQDFRQLIGSSKHFYTNNSSSSSSSTKVYIKEN